MEIVMPDRSETGVRGKMIIVEDRTEEQQLLDEIKNKNALLVKANERLMQSNNKLIEANKRLEKFTETVEVAIAREKPRGQGSA